MSLSFAHICIKTDNLKKTEKFYVDSLGLAKIFNFTKNNRKVGCYFRLSENSFIEVFEEDVDVLEENLQKTASSMAHLCLETDDIDGMIEKLNAFGIRTTPKKRGCDNTYQTWFKDPNGIDIELHEYTTESSQLTGQDVEIDW